nr:NADH dehydrogenase subunit 4L [Actinocyclus sp. mgcode 4]
MLPIFFVFKNNFMICTNLNYFLLVTFLLFTVGLMGLILNRKNFLIVIISIELLLLAINLNFVVFSVYLDDIVGQIFVVFILSIAATESAIGLAILILYFKIHNTIIIDSVKTKKS